MRRCRPGVLRAGLLALCIAAGLPGLAVAEPSVFFGLGGLTGPLGSSAATAVSSDGEVVVGQSFDALGDHVAFRWTAEGGMVGLGALSNSLGTFSHPTGASGDGAVVVGWTADPSTSLGIQPCLWNASSAFVLEELLPLPRPDRVTASAVSDDGQTIVGAHPDGPFHHLTGPGLVLLGTLPGGITGGTARGVSEDGSAIAGWARNASGIGVAFHWTAPTGLQALGDLPGGGTGSDAFDVSADGTTVVGYGSSDFGREAFRWTEETGMVGLGDIPGGNVYSTAYGVSGDGSVVVGVSSVGPEDVGDRAFVWDAQNGMRELRSVLVSHGVDMTGWTLIEANAVSNDGRVIVGWGFGPDGHDEAFYARLDEPMGLPGLGSAGLLALVGLLASAGLLVSRKPTKRAARGPPRLGNSTSRPPSLSPRSKLA